MPRRKNWHESKYQRQRRIEAKRLSQQQRRQDESQDQRQARLESVRLSQQQRRQDEYQDQRQARLESVRLSQQQRRQDETAGQRQDRMEADRRYQQIRRKDPRRKAACKDDVCNFKEVLSITSDIGSFIDSQCRHCRALKWPAESESTCCAKGKIKLDPVRPYPPSMVRLYDINEGSHFIKNIVAYNNLLALASLGYQEPNDGIRGFRPTFKIQGKMYHRIGSLLPTSGEQPKFAQLYFHDSDFELQNRMSTMQGMKEEIIQILQEEVRSCNPYIQAFKAAIEHGGEETKTIVLFSESKRKPSDEHCRRYNLPLASEVAAIMPGGSKDNNLDVIIHCRNGGLQRINPIHRSYDPLFYILLFPQGDDGWQRGLTRTDGRTLSASDFYSYRLQVRSNDPSIIMKSRRLMQQYAVDSWAKIEGSRMVWVQHNQKSIRADKYCGLIDAIGDGDSNNAGRRVILPPTIYGSPRFYNEQFKNSMTVVRHYGKPDYFITFTTNSQWKEIRDALFPGEEPRDRPDLCARVFKLKFDSLMDDLLKREYLGKVRAHSCTIEWQKRGLTHAHILLIMDDKDKPKRPEDIDKAVCAEIPDPDINPELHKIVSTSMVHGPCGSLNWNSPCMEGGIRENRRCTKDFPKPFRRRTMVREDAFPEYRRRSPDMGGRTITKIVDGKMTTVDNSFIVPYNPFLTLRYNAHINCEVVYSVEAVKYLYKYILKGSDRIVFTVRAGETDEHQVHDEVETFLNARYISASEAFWRIYEFPIHSRKPSIEKLPCHLPEQQMIVFEEGNAEAAVEQGPPETKLTAWFKLNTSTEDASHILYPDIPKYYTWNSSRKEWKARKRGMLDENHMFVAETLGRVPTISLSRHQSELYFLRTLLHHCPGAKSYDDLRTIDGEVCETFQTACVRMGLLEDDTEKDRAMEEAKNLQFGNQLRDIFATILLFCTPAEPLAFWERWLPTLAQDIMHQQNIRIVTDLMKNTILLYLQERVEREGLCLHEDFGLPLPDPEIIAKAKVPRVLREETEFDMDHIEEQLTKVDNLNAKQREAFDKVMASVNNDAGRIFCLNAKAGSGKTYTINLLLAQVRYNGKIAIATALSGIAATLLENGRTLHSRCKVPLEIKEESTCSFTRRDATGHLMQKAHLLVIDEVSMGHRHIFEAIDRSLRDVRQCENRPFGGLTVLFAGDWQQILPVVRHGARPQIVEAILKNSDVWQHVETLDLIENMRVARAGEGSDIAEFTAYLNDIGSGKLPIDKELGEFKTAVPNKFILQNNTLQGLCDFVFDGLEHSHCNAGWLANRTIIAPTNNAVDQINDVMMRRFPGEEVVYKSCDTVDNEHLYPIEFINRLTPPGFPPHVLKIKKGSCIMLLRNFDSSAGHCNGTRYIVLETGRHIIEAMIATGPHEGKRLFIPRIPMSPSDNIYPFIMKRKQFPIRPAFGVTANKSQGQTLHKIGIYLPSQMFSHGQYYVANSRVGSSNALKIVTEYHADNVVYPEVL